MPGFLCLHRLHGHGLEPTEFRNGGSPRLAFLFLPVEALPLPQILHFIFREYAWPIDWGGSTCFLRACVRSQLVRPVNREVAWRRPMSGAGATCRLGCKTYD